jgi:hypothetical protein
VREAVQHMREAVQHVPAEALSDVRTAVQHYSVDGQRYQRHTGAGSVPEVRHMPEAVQHVPQAVQHLQQIIVPAKRNW